MSLIDKLTFVHRAAADKDIIPVLTHIYVHGGKVQASDARITLEVPAPELQGHSFTIPAEKFIRAVANCPNDPKIERVENKVKIVAKPVRVSLQCCNVTDYPYVEFKTDDAVRIEAPGEFLPALRRLFGFISTDATRPWSLGVRLSTEYFYATNNVTMARVPVKWSGPEMNLPRFVIEKLLEIDMPVVEIWASANSISFKFSNGGWMRGQLYASPWPDVSKMFEQSRQYVDVPEGLLSAVQMALPFCGDPKFPVIFLTPSGVATDEKGMSRAEVDFAYGLKGAYRGEVLELVLPLAKRWTPDSYPGPVFWEGEDGMEGLMVGVRQQ